MVWLLQVLRTQFVESSSGKPSTRLLLGSEARVQLQVGSAPADAVNTQPDGTSVAIVAGTQLQQQWNQLVSEPFDLYTSRLLRMKVRNFVMSCIKKTI